MITIVTTKEGNEISFQTQQYEIGMYLIINNNAGMQNCLDTTEEKYHKKLRKKVIKGGDTFTGTIL